MLCCRWTGWPDRCHTRRWPFAGDKRRRSIRGTVVHGHSAATEHRRQGGDNRFKTSTTIVVHQRWYAVRFRRRRGRFGHRVGHLYPVGAQPARTNARPDRVPTQVQKRSEEGTGVWQWLFRRHTSSILHTRARRLRHWQHIQDSREPGPGWSARFWPVPSKSTTVMV